MSAFKKGLAHLVTSFIHYPTSTLNVLLTIDTDLVETVTKYQIIMP